MAKLHVYSNRHIKTQIFNVKKNDWVVLENKISQNRWSLYFRKNNINETLLNIKYISQEEYFNFNNIKFDAIVGNPPYQDNSIDDNQQNKIYNQFSKKALDLVSDTGTVAFITPVSVAQVSKRFALTTTPGVKQIDFTANKHFNVGTKICSWVVDKKYSGKIKVISDNGVDFYDFGSTIFDPSTADPKFVKLASRLQKLSIAERGFKQNNHGPAYSKTQTAEHIYPTYKVKDGDLILSAWTKRKPWFYGKRKLSVSRSKSFNESVIQVSTKDFETQYVTIEIENDKQIDNIKSFLFSDYFIEHMNNWKALYNTGFNDALKYVPPFDKNKHWTNEEVTELFETYAQ